MCLALACMQSAGKGCIALNIQLQQAEIRISLRTTPFLLDSLQTFTFYNNTQRQSSLLLLSLSIFVIAISLRKKVTSIKLYVKNTFILACDSLQYTLIVYIISFGTFLKIKVQLELNILPKTGSSSAKLETQIPSYAYCTFFVLCNILLWHTKLTNICTTQSPAQMNGTRVLFI